jgi:hypothetical protein
MNLNWLSNDDLKDLLVEISFMKESVEEQAAYFMDYLVLEREAQRILKSRN